jgi:hypothetical protein
MVHLYITNINQGKKYYFFHTKNKALLNFNIMFILDILRNIFEIK